MKKILIFVILVSLLLSPSLVKADTEKAAAYLKQQPPNDWITMALAAAGENNLPYEHLKTLSDISATDYEKRILAITSLGFDPKNFFGQDFVQRLLVQYKNNQIGNENLLNDDFWGILALASASEDSNSETIQNSKKFILSHQNQDGGFGYAIKTNSDTNDTAAAIMALLEAGLTKYSYQIKQGIKYLKKSQNSDAGFPFQQSNFSDGASTAWVISALYKSEENLLNWQKQGKTPLDFLKSLQQEDGSFVWQATDSKGSSFVTSYAVIALAGKSYPIKKINQKETEKDKKEEKKEMDKKKKEKKTEKSIRKFPDKKTTKYYFKKITKKQKDSDSDGLPDEKERFYKTNPKKWDTDGDGFSDGIEVAKGYDPLSPAPCSIKKFSKNSKIFAYGKPRLSPKKQEQCYARYLKKKLKKYSRYRIKANNKNWFKMIKAFIYGNYSVFDIVKAIKFGGKTVHPVLPKSTWRKSVDYQIYTKNSLTFF
ncbi:MAG: prenyltransferase/squalene oxidase repeat-containing protein [Patescibacteria group bacterium]